MIVGDAKPASSVSVRAPTAWAESSAPAVASRIAACWRTGSSIPTGSCTHIGATSLPSASACDEPRTSTGTSARSASPSVSTPRWRRKRPSAPATTASTASLTVPPRLSLTRCSVASSASTQV